MKPAHSYGAVDADDLLCSMLANGTHSVVQDVLPDVTVH